MKNRTKLLAYITGIIMFLGIGSLPVFSMEVEASSEMELMKIAISHLKEDLSVLEEEIEALKNDPAADGVGISKIEQTATQGNVDTYTITMTDGTTYQFTVENGQDGEDGKDGKDGKNGVDGKDGVGISKIEQTATEGNVDIYTITMTDGSTFDFSITNGQDGQDGADGENAVSEAVSNTEASSSMGTIAMIISSISLIGTIIMGTWMLKNKRN